MQNWFETLEIGDSAVGRSMELLTTDWLGEEIKVWPLTGQIEKDFSVLIRQWKLHICIVYMNLANPQIRTHKYFCNETEAMQKTFRKTDLRMKTYKW